MMKGMGEFPAPAAFDRVPADGRSSGAAMARPHGQHPVAQAAGKQVLYLIQTDAFIPCFWRLSNHLGARGYRSMFAAFQPRERLWLRKNGIRTQPESVHGLKDYPIKAALFDARQVDQILAFALAKSGGRRKDWEQRLLTVASFLDDLLAAHEFSAVLIWNGEDFIGRALAIIARRRGVRTIFCENGYFPNTLQFDLEGVNVHSAVSKLSFSEILQRLENAAPALHPIASAQAIGEQRLAPLEWTDFVRCFLARKANPLYYRQFPEHRGGSWFKSQWLRMKRSWIPQDVCTLPDKFVFIPFQVHDDTQILLNSKFFKSMEEFFEFCHIAIRRNFGEEYAIVVKEHPEDLGRHSYGSLRHRYPDVLWLRKFSVDVLLDRASLVFVVNSSVGLQALQRKRPTVTFGESFYARKEIAFPVDSLEGVDDVITNAQLGVTPERGHRIDKFIRFLEERYFVRGGWKNASASSIAAAGDRIIELIEAMPTATGSPEQGGDGPLRSGSMPATAPYTPFRSEVSG